MNRNLDQEPTLDAPDAQIVGITGLARMLGISPATIATKRTRAPEELPPSFLDRPARWRRETVIRWIAQREADASRRAQERARPIRSRVLRMGS